MLCIISSPCWPLGLRQFIQTYDDFFLPFCSPEEQQYKEHLPWDESGLSGRTKISVPSYNTSIVPSLISAMRMFHLVQSQAPGMNLLKTGSARKLNSCLFWKQSANAFQFSW